MLYPLRRNRCCGPFKIYICYCWFLWLVQANKLSIHLEPNLNSLACPPNVHFVALAWNAIYPSEIKPNLLFMRLTIWMFSFTAAWSGPITGRGLYINGTVWIWCHIRPWWWVQSLLLKSTEFTPEKSVIFNRLRFYQLSRRESFNVIWSYNFVIKCINCRYT